MRHLLGSIVDDVRDRCSFPGAGKVHATRGVLLTTTYYYAS
jgi:hypothetical protein